MIYNIMICNEYKVPINIHGVGDNRIHDLRGFRFETRTYNIILFNNNIIQYLYIL